METRPLKLIIDPNQAREIARQGMRTAAAFLGMGLPLTENYIPSSLALKQHSLWHFFPEPLPEQLGRDAVREFRSWLVGNALRELDAHFNRFLDEIWMMLAWSKLHGTVVRSDHTVRQISNETNAANKLKLVMQGLGEEQPDTSMLWSLSNARNCLTHNFGVVEVRYAKSAGALVIRWTAFEARIQQGDQHVVVPPVIIDGLQAPDPSQEADLVMVVVEREKRFAIGEKIELTPGELHEICIYYWRLADQVTEKFIANIVARGTATPQ
jgi:hypothetical protein